MSTPPMLLTKRGAKQTFDYLHMCTVVTAVENATSDAGKKLYYQFNDSGNVVAMRDELGYGQFAKFEAGVDNKPSEISKLRKVVVNQLLQDRLFRQWNKQRNGGEGRLHALPGHALREADGDGGQRVVLPAAGHDAPPPDVHLQRLRQDPECPDGVRGVFADQRQLGAAGKRVPDGHHARGQRQRHARRRLAARQDDL